MIKAIVVGRIWCTKQVPGIPKGAFLEVEALGGGSRVVALDILGSDLGERVLVATGSVAASQFPDLRPPIDALIIGSIDDDINEQEGDLT